MKTGFVKIELNKTIWEVPERYQQLAPVGSGAYGQVWYVKSLVYFLNLKLLHFTH